ncbi:hypothetical protein HHI36_000907 [Cryptolaemus montrouzieri]|uniref:Peptidase S1 domain-containing protein n=1 Tax=Cryptolaemus montrouzieri TaxID=559131 RepID=A0ABD2P686_9CUCU
MEQTALNRVAETLISNEKLGDSTTPPKPTIAVTSEKLSTSTTTSEKPSLITWTVDDSRRNTTEEDNFINTTTEDWRPITTPDGWVLLPSVSSAGASVSTSQDVSVTTASPKDKFTTTTYEENISVTQKPEMNLTTQSPPSSEPTNSTSTSYSTETITTSEMQYTSSVSINNPMTTLLPESNGTSSSTTTETSEVITSPVNMSDFTNVCGRRMYPEARIVGGEKSSFGKWPWQISLRQWRTSTYLHKCGAALLNENWAITAAHCVDNVPPSDLLLRLGEHDLSTESEPYLHQERRVQIVASHPQFDPRTFEYDLALLRFYEPVTFQPNIIPVCVPQSDENFVGRTAYVTGWGRLYEDGPLPSVLQEVSVPVINNSVCESMYRSAGYIEHIPHIFICAGWRRGGYDSCEGDSGGPMVIQREDKRFLLAGVISWGIGCAEPNQPGVYTRISEFRDWINQILQF